MPSERKAVKCDSCGRDIQAKVHDVGTPLEWPTTFRCPACRDLLKAEHKFQEACGFWNRGQKALIKRLGLEKAHTVISRLELTRVLVLAREASKGK